MTSRVREVTVLLWLVVVRSRLEYSCGDVCGEAGKLPVKGNHDGQELRAQVSLSKEIISPLRATVLIS